MRAHSRVIFLTAVHHTGGRWWVPAVRLRSLVPLSVRTPPALVPRREGAVFPCSVSGLHMREQHVKECLMVLMVGVWDGGLLPGGRLGCLGWLEWHAHRNPGTTIKRWCHYTEQVPPLAQRCHDHRTLATGGRRRRRGLVAESVVWGSGTAPERR